MSRQLSMDTAKYRHGKSATVIIELIWTITSQAIGMGLPKPTGAHILPHHMPLIVDMNLQDLTFAL